MPVHRILDLINLDMGSILCATIAQESRWPYICASIQPTQSG